MRISLIAAVAANNVIGRAGKLPWHLPDDLKRFKRLTMGKPIIMGRATYESIGRPLPGRQNIVLSRDAGYLAPGCTAVDSVRAALSAADGAEEVMVIGGSGVYEQFLPIAERIYLTRILADVEGDTFFPALVDAEWRETAAETAPTFGTDYDVEYVTLEARRGDDSAR